MNMIELRKMAIQLDDMDWSENKVESQTFYELAKKLANIIISEAIMKAYPDSKCSYGYKYVCANCRCKAPKHVDLNNPIFEPIGKGKIHYCEICKDPFEVTGVKKK